MMSQYGYDIMSLPALIAYKKHISKLITNSPNKNCDFYYHLIDKRNAISNEISYRIKRGYKFHEK